MCSRLGSELHSPSPSGATGRPERYRYNCWTPIGAFGSALLFALFLQISQLIKIAPPAGDLGTIMSSVPAQLWDALPYILTIVILAGVVGRSIPPAADGQPYEREAAA